MKKTIAMALIMIAAAQSKASTFMANGKEISKGQAILILAKDPKAEVLKIDKQELNFEKGTLKNVKK